MKILGDDLWRLVCQYWFEAEVRMAQDYLYKLFK